MEHDYRVGDRVEWLASGDLGTVVPPRLSSASNYYVWVHWDGHDPKHAYEEKPHKIRKLSLLELIAEAACDRADHDLSGVHGEAKP